MICGKYVVLYFFFYALWIIWSISIQNSHLISNNLPLPAIDFFGLCTVLFRLAALASCMNVIRAAWMQNTSSMHEEWKITAHENAAVDVVFPTLP